MTKDEKAFIRGAAYVIAHIHRGHGEETSTREAFRDAIGNYQRLIEANCDPFDLEMLEMFKPKNNEKIFQKIIHNI